MKEQMSQTTPRVSEEGQQYVGRFHEPREEQAAERGIFPIRVSKYLRSENRLAIKLTDLRCHMRMRMLNRNITYLSLRKYFSSINRLGIELTAISLPFGK